MAKRILLCDDEVHILRAAEFKLLRAGFDVVCASDGEEGWQRIQEARPDMIITDCQMPRLDGLGLAARIRGTPELNGLPIIMLTAKGYELSHGDVEREYGIMAVLAKPFSPRELLQYVHGVLGGAADETAAPAAKA
jgi:two-component system alkaline phosphatase synthesis response regulator PhoP